jgi:hypothetical protein
MDVSSGVISQYCSNIYHEGPTNTVKIPRKFSLQIYERGNAKPEVISNTEVMYLPHGHEANVSPRTHVTSRNKTEQDSAGLG